MGVYIEKEQKLYNRIQKAGFQLIYKRGDTTLVSRKKGNVDTNIVFYIMKEIIENKNLNKIVLISGDGDYIDTVEWLQRNNKLEKVIFPNARGSSLYKHLGNQYTDLLSKHKNKLEYRQ